MASLYFFSYLIVPRAVLSDCITFRPKRTRLSLSLTGWRVFWPTATITSSTFRSSNFSFRLLSVATSLLFLLSFCDDVFSQDIKSSSTLLAFYFQACELSIHLPRPSFRRHFCTLSSTRTLSVSFPINVGLTGCFRITLGSGSSKFAKGLMQPYGFAVKKLLDILPPYLRVHFLNLFSAVLDEVQSAHSFDPTSTESSLFPSFFLSAFDVQFANVAEALLREIKSFRIGKSDLSEMAEDANPYQKLISYVANLETLLVITSASSSSTPTKEYFFLQVAWCYCLSLTLLH